MTSLVLMYFTSCVNTDFWLDKITPESRHTRELRYLLQKSVPWAGKTPNMYRFCWKVELLSTFCKNFSQPATTWFVARQVGTWEVKRATSFFNLFCSNVAKQVACVCFPFYRILIPILFVPAFSTGPPVSFTFAPPSSQFVIVWSQKTVSFGRLDETGTFVRKIFHKG